MTTSRALSAPIRQARLAWPDLACDEAEFGRYLSERIPADPFALERLRAADLLLAFACVRGDARALKAFEDQYLCELPRYLCRLRPSAQLLDEVRARLREKLFDRDASGVCGLTEYSGQGPLGAWVRVTAVRVALDLRRANQAELKRRAPTTDDTRIAADAEHELIRHQQRTSFERAFEAALASLPNDQKRVLRLHFLDALGLEQIGELFKVNRSTIVRWIAQARSALSEETYRFLVVEERLRASEADELLALLPSRLELSLRRLLKKR
ncbi:MAG: sigma-70 family RNA polymerase sigma factor [Deltaproteobacteria bacterium]|nr:sigma-70 family RNA polymerase sigma factor [Deltaproteobacteria bacterium]